MKIFYNFIRTVETLQVSRQRVRCRDNAAFLIHLRVAAFSVKRNSGILYMSQKTIHFETILLKKKPVVTNLSGFQVE